MRKKSKLVISFVILMLVATLSLLMLSKIEACLTPTLPDGAGGSGTPVTWKPAGVDRDNNGIADSLDQEIADRVTNGTAQDYVNVTVMLKSAPTTHDEVAFASCDGYLTTSPWTEALYGFGGTIPYNEIANFAKQCPSVLLIEKEAVGHATIDYAAQQVGARTYVWSTLGLQGDPNSSVAIIDTGIDPSHPDFSPGFGDQNFSEKIVGWNDQINATATPFDDNGHGSHVSGLAAGDGFFSVDASGDATATWGANLTAVNSTGMYQISGMMVNKTGIITIRVKWATTGTATLAALPLYYGGKTLSIGSWTSVNSTYTPNQNTWYTLTYNVTSTPSGGYDMYHVMMALTQGTGNLYVVFTMSWPYTPPSDGFPAWTGIAPQAKLVGVKVVDQSGSVTSTELINGINWIIANRMTYHITVASMSLGFDSEKTAVDLAVVNLVNSGVTTVVAAGNSGSGSNYIYTPGSVDEVITVAAMNQFDNITDYSSQGGASGYTGQTGKPDITAPGGSFYAVPLFSADSNNGDGEGWWSDVQANDSAPMQGTSMSAPIVAGAADIVMQAMGGYAKWNWTRSQALQPKMILLMTATETYPNLRENGSSLTSPSLNRGGKDIHEGFGRMNLDAAVDAVNKTYIVGTTVTGTLGRPPTPSDISVLGQRLAWARNVQLVSGQTYNFSLSVPLGADYDLYIYNSTGTTNGEPSIVARSYNATTGGTEQFWVKAPYTGTYYIVVKRATETTGSGTFTLTSLGPVYVTFGQTGVSSDFTGTVVTIDGTDYGYSNLPKSFWWYNGTSHTFAYSSQLVVTANQKQYVLTSVNETSPLTASKNETVTGTYKTQYYVTFSQTGVSSDFTGAVMNVEGSNYTVGTLPVSFWYDSGSDHNFTSYSPLIVTSSQKQYVWTSTTGLSTSQSGSITVSDYGSVTGNYKTQYYITVTSAHDTPTASTWVDSAAGFTASVTSPTEIVAGDYQWVCTGFSVDGAASTPGTSYTFTSVGAAHTIVFSWKEQFWIVFRQSGVGSDFSGAVMTINGTGYDRTGYLAWADSGSVFNFTYSSLLVVFPNGKQYVLAGVNETTGFTVSSFETISGTYKTQWYVTFAQSGVGTDFSGTVVVVDGVNFDRSGVSFWWDDQSTHSFSFQSPFIAAANVKRYLWNSTTGASTKQSDGSFQVTTSDSVTGNYKTQWYITLNQTGVGADFAGTVVTIDGANYSVVGLPVSFWYDSGSGHTFMYQSPLVATASRKQYVWTFTSGLSTSQSGIITVSGYGAVTGNYKTQYYITVASAHDTPTASAWVNEGSDFTASVTSPTEIVAGDHRWVCTGFSVDGGAAIVGVSYTFTDVQAAHNASFSWKEQFWVEVDSTHDSPTNSQWVDEGADFTASVSSPTEVVASDHRWVCTGYSVDGGAPQSGITYTFTNAQAPHTINFSWEEQFWLQVNSTHDNPTTSRWVDQNTDFTASVTSPTEIVAGDHRWVCTGFSVDGGAAVVGVSYTFLNVQTAHSIVFSWKEQFWVEVDSVHDAPTASQWKDQGSSLTVSVTSPADDNGVGTRYRCTGYTLDNNPPVTDGSISYDFASIQSAHIIAFNWMAQRRVTFDQTGIGTHFSGTVVTIDEANYGLTGVNTLPASLWWDNGSSHNFLFSSPLIMNASTQQRWVSTTGLTLLQSGTLTVTSSGTETGNYGPEELIPYTLDVSTVGSGYVSLNVSGPCHYGDVVQCTAVPAADWNFAGWGGDLSGSANPATLTITGNMSIAASFTLKPVLKISPTIETCRKYGENFNVTVQLSNALNVEDFKFEIHYNSTLLSVGDVSWNAWGSGTYNVDAANGNLSGYTSGSPLNGNVTLMTVTFRATYHHIWKDISGWTNDLSGTIYVQWANLSSPSGPDLGYVRGGAQNKIIVGQDVTYTFSPIQGDLYNDGTVDLFDLRTMAAFYDQQNPTYDLMGHGTIDIYDLAAIAANFGFTY